LQITCLSAAPEKNRLVDTDADSGNANREAGCAFRVSLEDERNS